MHGNEVFCEEPCPVLFSHFDNIDGRRFIHCSHDVKQLYGEIWRWGARGFRNIPTRYMFSEEEIVEKIGLKGGVCCCLQESGNESCKGLVFDGMQSQATMMVRSVDDYFLRFGKQVLICISL